MFLSIQAYYSFSFSLPKSPLQYTFDDLLDLVQASESELGSALGKIQACCIQGTFHLIPCLVLHVLHVLHEPYHTIAPNFRGLKNFVKSLSLILKLNFMIFVIHNLKIMRLVIKVDFRHILQIMTVLCHEKFGAMKWYFPL